MARDGDEIWTRAGRNPNWTARPSREWWGGGGEGGRVAREWRNLKFCGIKNRSKKKNISRLRWSPEHGEFIYSQIVEISFGRTFVCFDQRTVLNFIRAFGRVVWRETLEWEGRRERERDGQREGRGGKNWSRPAGNGVKIFTKSWPVWRLDIDDKKVERIVITEKCKFTVTFYSPDRTSISK